MWVPLHSSRSSSDDLTTQTLMEFDRIWQDSPPADLDLFLQNVSFAPSPELLCALAKIDLQYRLERGQPAEARDYLRRFPELNENGDRALSLIYEEFCLREEAGEKPNPDSFCDRYPSWRDSLASQLVYHQALSIVDSAPSSPTKYPSPGERFNKFELNEILGRGGSACVFLATDRSLGGRQFVLKISKDRGGEPSILGRLSHRHIVTVHSVDVEPESGLRGLCMPYLPGVTLDKVLRQIHQNGSLRLAEKLLKLILPGGDSPSVIAPVWTSFPLGKSFPYGVAWIAQKLAEALAHAHGKGVLHRDVKPANILLTFEEGPKLLDFNLAHDPNAADQAEAALKGGTLPYMAPEQLRAFLSPDRWSEVGEGADIYALGLVMREMLTGIAAEELTSSRKSLPRAIQDTLDRRTRPLAPLRSLNPSVPHALAAIVDRCLEFEPSRRYPTAQDLAIDLGNFLEHKPTQVVQNPSAFERGAEWLRRRNRGRKIVIALAILGPLCLWAATAGTQASKVQIARNLYLSDKYEKALPLLERLTVENPGDQELALYLASSLYHLERYDEARDRIKELTRDSRSIPVISKELDRLPRSDEMRLMLAAAYVHHQDYDHAIDNYLKVQPSGPQHVQALLGLANVYKCKGDVAELRRFIEAALDSLKEEVERQPALALPLSEIGQKLVEIEMRLFDDAVKSKDLEEAKTEARHVLAHCARIAVSLSPNESLGDFSNELLAVAHFKQAELHWLTQSSSSAEASLTQARNLLESIPKSRRKYLKRYPYLDYSIKEIDPKFLGE